MGWESRRSLELAIWAQFARTFALATDSGRGVEVGLGKVLADAGYGPKRAWRHYLAFLEGKSVATSSLYSGAGVAGLYPVATIHQARGRGIATGLVLKLLRQARETGFRLGTLQATKMGFGIYSKIGFEVFCRFGFYVGRAGDLRGRSIAEPEKG